MVVPHRRDKKIIEIAATAACNHKYNYGISNAEKQRREKPLNVSIFFLITRISTRARAHGYSRWVPGNALILRFAGLPVSRITATTDAVFWMHHIDERLQVSLILRGYFQKSPSGFVHPKAEIRSRMQTDKSSVTWNRAFTRVPNRFVRRFIATENVYCTASVDAV